MKKLIIKYDDNIPILDVLEYVSSVVRRGRISGINEDTFCYCSKFYDGTMVFADKTKSETDTFRVERE